LYENDVVCISAKPGTGKSLLAMQMMFNLTTGKPFLETYGIPKPKNVLYVQTEGDRAETIERIGNMKMGVGIDDSKWVHVNLPGVILNTPKGLDELMTLIEVPRICYNVIIIDPLYTTVKGSMSKDDVATDWVRNARKLKGHYNATMLVLHHDTKDIYDSGGGVIDKGADHIFGSIFWGAFLSQNFKLRLVRGTHYLELGKQRSGKMVDKIAMKLVEPRPLMFKETDESESAMDRLKDVLRKEDRKMNIKEIVEKSKLSKASAYRVLKKLDLEKESVNGVVYYGWRG
jgi:RecA-family ATPase